MRAGKTVSHIKNHPLVVENMRHSLSKEGSFYWDSETKVTHYSGEAWNLLNFNSNYRENSSKKLFNRLHTDDKEHIVNLFKNAINKAAAYNYDFRICNEKNVYVWMRVRANVSDENNTRYIVGIISDINDTQTLHNIQQKRNEFDKWTQKISLEVFESGNKKSIHKGLKDLCSKINASRGFLQIYNEETDHFDIEIEWREKGLIPFKEVLTNKEDKNIQHFLKHENKNSMSVLTHLDDIKGSDFYNIRKRINAESNINVTLILEEKVFGCMVLFSEKPYCWGENEVRSAEQLAKIFSLVYSINKSSNELLRSEERFSYAMNASMDGIWDYNITNNSVYLSPNYLGMLGLEPASKQVNSKEFLSYIHPEDSEKTITQFETFFNNSTIEIDLEFRILHKNGSFIWVLCRAKKVCFNDDGTANRIVGTHTNITKFKQLLGDLAIAESKAIDANSAKSEFLACMSHEIRTPMNAILGMTHLAIDTCESDRQKDYLGHIDDAAYSLLTIINDILDFSKIEARKLVIENIELDLHEIIDKLSSLFSLTASGKNLQLIFNIEPNVPDFFNGDSTRLTQILRNLIGNAIKFTDKGTISLSISQLTTQNRNLLEFKIQDTGKGLTKPQINKLFEPFIQAEKSITREYGGTGLGLTISKDLIELMGGDISVSSPTGKGCCFSFRLPISDERRLPSPPLINKLKNILLINVNKFESKAIENILTSFDCSVDTASSIVDIKTQHLTNYNLVIADTRTISDNEKLETFKPFIKHLSEKNIKKIILNHVRDKQPLWKNKITHIDIDYPITHSKLYRTFKKLLHTKDTHNDTDLDCDQFTDLQNIKILLAEDNIVNQMVAVGMLAKKSIEVDIANNGQEVIDFLDRFEPGHYSLILMDIEMPLISGYDASKIIRKEKADSNIPIVAMTAHAMSSNRELCLEAGMNDYISKPISAQHLYQSVRKNRRQ